MKEITKLSITLFFTVTIFLLHAQDNSEGIRFVTDQSFETLLEKAKAENKIIFIDCYADWCGPCKKLSSDVFPQKEVGDFFNSNFINVKYNTEAGEGRIFYNNHKEFIPGLPTMFLINGNGDIVHSIVGFRDAKSLLNEVELALSGKTITNLEKKYRDGNRDIEFIKDYFYALKNAYRNDDAKNVVEEFKSGLPVESLLDSNIWEISKDYIVNPFSPDYQFVISNLNKIQVTLKEDIPALERQLFRGILRAVKDILPDYQKKSVSVATLDSVSVLKGLLMKNALRESADMLGKFKIAELMRNDEPEKVLNFITFAQDVNLYRHEGLYLQSVYEYIAKNIEDPQLLENSLEAITKLQDRENKSSLPANFYTSMVLINNKLGNMNAAVEAQKKHDELEEKMNEKLGGLIKIFSGGKEK